MTSRLSTSSAASESFARPRSLICQKDEGSDPEFNSTRERIAKSNSPFREWQWELASCVASVSCLITMLILLLVYRNRAVPELSMGLTINAIISVLITAAKVAMLSAVAGAMGQIKWKWFRQNWGPLRNLDLFDEASRGGPWGAIHFLAKVRWSSPAAIGAVVLLLSLAMDPFAQQLLTYPVQLTYRDSPDASMTIARSVNPNIIHFDNIIQRYVTDAIWNNPRTFTTSCSSGNCTFPSFQSISWCPRCEDITNDVVVQGCEMAFDVVRNSASLSCNISISTGQNVTTWNRAICSPKNSFVFDCALSPAVTHVWEISTGKYGSWYFYENPITFLGQPHNMFGIGQVDLDYDSTHPFQALKVKHATGCVMNPCLRQYTVRTSAGATSVESTKISDGVAAMVNMDKKNIPSNFRNSTKVISTCWVSNYTLLSNEEAAILDHEMLRDDDMAYCADNDIFSRCTIDNQFALCGDEGSRQTAVIATLLSGNKTTTYYIRTNLPPEEITANISDSEIAVTQGATDYTSYTFQQMLQYRGLNATLQSIAESLTAMMQNISNVTITGQVGHVQAIVHVQWLWLLYPVAVIFLGIFLVFFTIVETTWIDKNTPVWKNSALPLVYHGLLEGVDERVRVKTMELRDMEKRASETVVKFVGIGLKKV